MSTAQRSRRLISTVHTTGVVSPVRIFCYSAVTIGITCSPPKEEEHTPPRAWRMQPPSTGSTTSATTDHQYNTVVAPRRPQRPIMRGISTFSGPPTSAPGRTRTGNLRIRRPMLYPLSYGGVREAPHQPTPSTRRPHPRRGGRPEAVINTRKRSREDHIAMTRTHRSERANGSAQPRRSRLTLLSTITAIRP